jgi:hypothetical protein
VASVHHSQINYRFCIMQWWQVTLLQVRQQMLKLLADPNGKL